MLKKIFLFMALSYTVIAQVVYEPLYSDIYAFLSILSQKSIIELNDQVRPLSRKYIAEKLIEASKKSDQLTSLEKEELSFYSKDFSREFDFINKVKLDSSCVTLVGYDAGDRLRLFGFTSDFFTLNIDPILGAQYGTRDNAKLTHIWNGLSTYGYIDDFIGFSFDFRDNLEKGSTIDKTKDFTPITGVDARTSENIVDYPINKMEYSEAKAVISLDWNWGSLAAGKDFFEWGYGESGLLVLSTKPPSYGFIRLDIHPVKWLRFNYIHGWLSSTIPDSNSFFYNQEGTISFSYVNKYIAHHSLTITPTAGLDLAIGESIIYDEKLEFLYLIPIMFFRLADHYLSNQVNAAGGNAQFFLSASSRGQIKNTHLYGTLFIDEITLNGLFDPAKQRNQFGFTLGGAITDLPVDNLTLKLEYTKIYPFVYQHYIQTEDYYSSGYTLGHWMMQNADLVYASVNYRFIRGLQATIWGQYLRKGQDGTVEQQYTQPQPPFLFGLRQYYTYYGAEVKYELINNFYARLQYQNRLLSDEQSPDVYVESNLPQFYFSIYYGL